MKLLAALAIVILAMGCSDQSNSPQTATKQRYDFIHTARGDLYRVDKFTGQTWMLEWEEEPQNGKMIRVVKGWSEIQSVN